MSEWELWPHTRVYPRGKSDYVLRRRGDATPHGKLALTVEQAASLAAALICDHEDADA